MSQKKWGHGFYTGLEKGVDYGQANGEYGGKMDIAEQVNLLVRQLCVVLCTADTGAEKWAIIRTLFDVVRPHIADPSRAAIPKLPAPPKETCGEADLQQPTAALQNSASCQ